MLSFALSLFLPPASERKRVRLLFKKFQITTRYFPRSVLASTPKTGPSNEVWISLCEGLKNQRPLVLDLFQRTEDLIPIDRAVPRQAPVAFSQVNLSQQITGAANRLRKAFLLDVHMVGVRMEKDVGRSDLPDRFSGIRYRVV